MNILEQVHERDCRTVQRCKYELELAVGTFGQQVQRLRCSFRLLQFIGHRFSAAYNFQVRDQYLTELMVSVAMVTKVL